MEHRLTYPFTAQKVRELKLGDVVYLSGEINFSAGMPTYQKMLEYAEQKRDLPFNLKNAALLHLGANSRQNEGNYEIFYVNPTTSMRFNPYMPALVKKYELRIVGGKGGMDDACVAALKEIGCVYLAFLGGGAPIYSKAMKGKSTVFWEELVPHYRVTRTDVNELGPLIVAIDAHGNSLYEQVATNLNDKFEGIVDAFES